MGLAKGIILSRQVQKILLITSKTYSKYIHNNDKSNKTIFADAYAPTIVSNIPGLGLNGSGLDLAYFTDGTGFDKLIIRNGCIKHKNETGQEDCN